MTAPVVLVVAVARDTKDAAVRCARSVLDHGVAVGFGVRLVVVDNASSDGTVEVAGRHRRRLPRQHVSDEVARRPTCQASCGQYRSSFGAGHAQREPHTSHAARFDPRRAGLPDRPSGALQSLCKRRPNPA